MSDLKKDLNFLSIKDIQIKMNVSRSTAQRIYSDIKDHFDLNTKPLFFHFNRYFKVS